MEARAGALNVEIVSAVDAAQLNSEMVIVLTGLLHRVVPLVALMLDLD
jgi:hypothetical protein